MVMETVSSITADVTYTIKGEIGPSTSRISLAHFGFREAKDELNRLLKPQQKCVQRVIFIGEVQQ
jgi:hypothetical protein